MRIVSVAMALAVGATLSPLGALSARAQVLSGTYDFNYQEICQATIAPTMKGSNVSKLVGTYDGKLGGTQVKAVFSPNKSTPTEGTYSMKGYQDSGDLVMISGASGNRTIKDERFLAKLGYSFVYNAGPNNTGTGTFTFTPDNPPQTQVTLNAVFVGLTSDTPPVIEYMEILGVDDGNTNDCYGHGTVILKSEQ